MLLYGFFDALGFNANVALSCSSTAVLKEPLNQDNVVTVGFVDLSGIPLSEAVSADILIAQIVADDVQLLLDRALCDGEYDLRASNTMTQAVILNVLVKHQGDSEDPALSCLLLHNLQAVTITIPYNVAQTELQNIADPKPQVALQNQRRGDAIIGSAAGKAFPHGLNDLFVLLCGQCFCFLIHSLLP